MRSIKPSYEQALEALFARQASGMKLGLEQINRLLNCLDHPENRFPAIHIAGTNGKGSTAALLESVLRQAGLHTGLYTSPHLIDVRERILIDGEPVSNQEFFDTLSSMKPHIETSNASFFEILTAIAFLIFSRRSVEAAILETGLGGRLDATNTVRPVLTIITEIGLNHTRILGSHLTTIAREKAGILKTGIPCVCGATPAKVRNSLREAASEANVPLRFSKEDVRFSRIELTEDKSTFDCDTGHSSYKKLSLNLLGRHQVRNAGLVLLAVDALRNLGWKIPEQAIRKGFASVRWPARLQLIPGRPKILLDSAHNPLGMKSLAEALKTFLKYRRFILVFGVLKEKNYRSMLAHISALTDHVVFTRP